MTMNMPHFEILTSDRCSNDSASILIVDDDLRMAQSIQNVLRMANLTASSINSGHEAIALLQEQPFDLVLLDLNMPDMDGAEVIEQINQLNIDTSIIVVSGESEIQKAIHVLKIGAKDYVRKPYNPDELLFSIKNVLEKQYLERENSEIYAKLEESEALHKFIVHNSPDMLYMLDRKGAFSFVNKNTVRLLGYRRNELIGRHYSEIIYAKDIERAKLFFQNSAFLRNTRSMELRLICKNGNILHVDVRALHINRKSSGGYRLGISSTSSEHFVGTYGVARDITEQKLSEEIISFQNNHDLLTGLPNRNLLQQKTNSLIMRSQDRQERFAVLFFDINRFKLINDTYGQNIGDDVLRSFAEMLKRNIREGDSLGRLGGDEFILLLPDIDRTEDTYAVANKILAEVSLPYLHEGHEIHLTLSIGIALFPDHGSTWEELMRNADTAVCTSKLNNRSRYCLYDTNLKNRNSNKVFIENLIRDALRHDRFEVLYQPQIDLGCRRIHGVEALVRITSPGDKLILPGKFIEIAEETELINEIGAVVRDRVCRDISFWHKQNISLRTAINVSAHELASDRFAEELFSKLCQYRVDASEIELELTENVIIQNMKKTISNIMTMTDAGIKIAIDDFGTGYSSLSYLDRLPLQTLKLDKSFIQKISTGQGENSIIPAVINVAKGLNLDFIAEGVETKSQHEYLLKHVPCIAQGFFYSRPLTSQQLTEFVQRHGGQTALKQRRNYA